MKYIVFTTKHHDGFSMWPTKLRADYSIASMPFHRDICRELADRCIPTRPETRLVLLDWRDGRIPIISWAITGSMTISIGARPRQLLSNYGRVDMLWFDHVAGNWRDYRFPELFETIYRLQPGTWWNNRAAAFFEAADIEGCAH